MSTTGQENPSQSRAMTEDEWRASLPSFGQQLGTGLGHSSFSASGTAPGTAPATAFGTAPKAPPVAPFSTLNTWKPGPSRSNTAAVWWFVFLPIIVSGVMMGALFAQLAPYFTGAVLTPANQQAMITALLNSFAIIMAISVLHAVATIWLAYLDRRGLRELGHTATASPWWNLLMPLIYLIVRSVHVNRAIGGGSAPLTVYVALYILPGLVLGIIAGVLQFL